MARRQTEELLHAYHDGELPRLQRWRVGRALRRSPEDLEALRRIALVGAWVRDSEGEAPAPELWSGIAGRLAGVDAELEADANAGRAGWREALRWFAHPVRAGAVAAAAITVAVLVSLPTGTGPGPELRSTRVVRSLVTEGKPVVVLPEEGNMTIIWVIEPPTLDEVSRRDGRGVA